MSEITIRPLKAGKCPEAGCDHMPPNEPIVPTWHDCYGKKVASLNGHVMRGIVPYLVAQRPLRRAAHLAASALG
jgi:hypothetical protein